MKKLAILWKELVAIVYFLVSAKLALVNTNEALVVRGLIVAPLLAGFLYFGLVLLTSKKWVSKNKKRNMTLRTFGRAAVVIPILFLIITLLLEVL